MSEVQEKFLTNSTEMKCYASQLWGQRNVEQKYFLSLLH